MNKTTLALKSNDELFQTMISFEYQNNSELICKLIENKYITNLTNSDIQILFKIAIKTSSINLIDILYQNNYINSNTVLLEKINTAKNELIEYLIKNKIKIDRESLLRSLLCEATYCSNTDKIDLLIQYAKEIEFSFDVECMNYFVYNHNEILVKKLHELGCLWDHTTYNLAFNIFVESNIGLIYKNRYLDVYNIFNYLVDNNCPSN